MNLEKEKYNYSLLSIYKNDPEYLKLNEEEKLNYEKKIFLIKKYLGDDIYNAIFHKKKYEGEDLNFGFKELKALIDSIYELHVENKLESIGIISLTKDELNELKNALKKGNIKDFLNEQINEVKTSYNYLKETNLIKVFEEKKLKKISSNIDSVIYKNLTQRYNIDKDKLREISSGITLYIFEVINLQNQEKRSQIIKILKDKDDLESISDLIGINYIKIHNTINFIMKNKFLLDNNDLPLLVYNLLKKGNKIENIDIEKPNYNNLITELEKFDKKEIKIIEYNLTNKFSFNDIINKIQTFIIYFFYKIKEIFNKFLNINTKEDIKINNEKYQSIKNDLNDLKNIEKYPDKKKFIETIKPYAMKIANELNIPVEVPLIMAAIESNWGNSELSRKYNNYFGIKYYPKIHGNKKYVSMKTKEKINGKVIDMYQNFIVFDSIEECFEHYKNLLKSDRYQNAIKNTNRKDPVAIINAIINAGYATVDYTKLAKIIKDKYFKT